MRRKNGTTLVSTLTTVLLFTIFSFCISRYVFLADKVRLSPTNFKNPFNNLNHPIPNNAITEDQHLRIRHVSSINDSPPPPPPPDSILLPDWELLLVSNPLSSDSDNEYFCLFQNNATSPAKFIGTLQLSKRPTFKCVIPNSVRRLRPLFRPVLTKTPGNWPENGSYLLEIFRWSFLAYESLSMENDVILFVKGVNNRQRLNRSPAELSCVFDDGVNYSVKTTVISSSQEVFRCHHPNETAIRRLFRSGDEKIKISLEIQGEERIIVPSVAYYTLRRNIADEQGKSLLCACTMVHNVAKFLKEWVIYHSKLGVEKFILYDNDSDDELQKVVEELVEEQYNVNTFFWPWPKTQEAGFSHSAMNAKGSCTWMMYMDVDEFVFSPSWVNSSYPSHNMLSSLLPITPLSSSSSLILSDTHSSSETTHSIGQISIRCLEFGPSNQQSHPIAGVTQGYTCRRRIEQRHKSIVLLDAIDTTLHNAIHHFRLKEGYSGSTLRLEEGVVNHYKYQAWSEFKAKFRRRVSAYVVDWRLEVNPMSKDRTPGLGFEAIEPKGWANKFCEVHDNRLKVTTQKWFGSDSPTGSMMAWQD